jgi:hypothetical protein
MRRLDRVMEWVGDLLLVGAAAAMVWVSFGPAPVVHADATEDATPIEWSAFGG